MVSSRVQWPSGKLAWHTLGCNGLMVYNRVQGSRCKLAGHTIGCRGPVAVHS